MRPVGGGEGVGALVVGAQGGDEKPGESKGGAWGGSRG